VLEMSSPSSSGIARLPSPSGSKLCISQLSADDIDRTLAVY